MKKLMVLLCAVLVSGTAFADSSDDWNISFNPLGLMLGIGNVRLDYKMTDQLTLGPGINFLSWKFGDLKISGFGASVNTEYFFNKAYEHSWIIGGGLNFLTLKATDEGPGASAEGKANSFGGNLVGGYHWFWGNSFNLRLAGGLAFTAGGKIEVKDSSGTVTEDKDLSGVSPTIDFALGFTF